MPLNDKKIQALKPTGKSSKHYDSAGLYLELTAAGSKLWRFRYQYAGKERLLSMGAYPAVGLRDARTARDEARALLAAGIDPSAERQARKASTTGQADTLEAIAREWLAEVHAKAVVAEHHKRNVRRLELHIFPALGKRPMRDIEPPELLTVLRTAEKNAGTETAHRIRNLLSQIWRYAIATMRATRDAAADLKDAIAPAVVRHQPAVTKLEDVAGLLRAIAGYVGQPTTQAALRLSAMLFVRPGELRRMRWADVRLEAAEWDYQPSKGGLPMTTPLPTRAVAILEHVHALTGRQEWVFPSLHGGRGRPMSENTINAALRRMGYADTHTAHGFRALARTVLVERLNYPADVVEMQLGHAVRDANGRAYNRTTLLEQRRAMLEHWSDYLEALETNAANNVVAIRSQA